MTQLVFVGISSNLHQIW